MVSGDSLAPSLCLYGHRCLASHLMFSFATAVPIARGTLFLPVLSAVFTSSLHLRPSSSSSLRSPLPQVFGTCSGPAWICLCPVETPV